MTLPGVVFFPHAMLPLHIFEPRYRTMVEEVLGHERMFCVAGVDGKQAEQQPEQIEPPHKVGTLGLIRACHLNPDGTRNLMLQGLVRIKIEDILQETPYRKIRFSVLQSQAEAKGTGLYSKRGRVLQLLRSYHRLGGDIPEGVLGFLKSLEDCESFIDTAIFTLCEDPELKQELLETLDLERRYSRFILHQRACNQALLLERELRGGLKDDHIGDN